MQKFDTPTPISAVLDLPAGRIQFVAADRADTTVEVRPANPSKSRDIKTAEQTTVAYADGVLRITASTPGNQLFGPSGSLEVTVQLPAGSRIEAKAASAELRGVGRLGDVAFEGAYRQIKIDEAASVRLTAIDGDVEVGQAQRPRGDQHRKGRHPDHRGRARHGRAPHTVRRHHGRRRRRRLGRPGRRHRSRPHQQRPQERWHHRTRHPRHHLRRRHHRPQPLKEQNQVEHMTKNNTSSTNSKWTGMVPVDDTALAVTDTGGPGIPVIYLNGQFATQGYWRRVIAELGTGWRHITYDERARGKSKRSADYSFVTAVQDVDAILAARDVDRALLVGWSYGAVVGAHWASRNPARALGAVLVDGAYPYDWLDEAMEQRIRKLFRRMSWFTPLLRPTGLTPRMTAGQQADSNIELGRLSRERELGPVLDNISVPVRYVVASGTSLGSRGDEQERIRTSLDAVTARNPNIEISAKVASNHGAILKKDFPAIAEAVREVAALDRGRR